MDLEKFLAAQEDTYTQALKEVKEGRKTSHWIWWIFPQMKGLGSSYNSNYYGISGLEEARAYLDHPVLGQRLREITGVLLNLAGKTAKEVFGGTDAMKVRSCMTLFDKVADDGLFRQVIDRYFDGKADRKTLKLLGLGQD